MFSVILLVKRFNRHRQIVVKIVWLFETWSLNDSAALLYDSYSSVCYFITSV